MSSRLQIILLQFILILMPLLSSAQVSRNFSLSPVFTLGHDTDAFSSIACVSDSVCLAGKRSWVDFPPYQAFYRSVNKGLSWEALPNPEGISGAHVYYFGQNAATVIAGTGDTGQVSLMRSFDLGQTWSVVLSSKQIAQMAGPHIAAIFSPLSFGNSRWLVNLRNDASASTKNIYMLESLDDGISWHAYKTTGLNCSARKVLKASNGTLIYSGFQGGIWISRDAGFSWKRTASTNAFSGQLEVSKGVYLVGTFDYGHSPTTIQILKSDDDGQTWKETLRTSLRSETSYFRNISLAPDGQILAFSSSSEFEQTDRESGLFISKDDGETWQNAGETYDGTYGNLNAVYESARVGNALLFATQPDSMILRAVWPSALH